MCVAIVIRAVSNSSSMALWMEFFITHFFLSVKIFPHKHPIVIHHISMPASVLWYILCVRGNCDTEVDQMVLEFPVLADYCVIAEEERLIYATHGHNYNEQKLPSPFTKASPSVGAVRQESIFIVVVFPAPFGASIYRQPPQHRCKELLAAYDREGAERLLLLGDILYHGETEPGFM